MRRRDFLKQATLISLAPTVPAFLAEMARGSAPGSDRRILVVVQLSGGNDGLNTVVPYQDENYRKLRPRIAIAKDRVIRLADGVGLNPAMRDAAELFREGRLSIVQGVGYPNPNKSHDVSMAIWQTARFDATEHRGYGWIGRALDEVASSGANGPETVLVGSDLPPVALRGRKSVAAALDNLDDMIVHGNARPYPAAGSHPMAGRAAGPVADESLAAFVRRSTLDGLTAADRLQEAARRARDSSPPPENELATRLALVSKLIKSDFGARVYYVTHSGYDTHAFERDTHDRLLRELSQALKFFLDDLKRAKLDDRMSLLAFSEFGRRVDENASEGTDHGTAAPVLLAGAKIKPGLHGAMAKLPAVAGVDPVASIDFRQVYQAILTKWLSVPSQTALDGQFAALDLF